MKVITKEILEKVIKNLRKKDKNITYDSISDELDMTRSVVIEQCKEFSDYIKEEKQKHLIYIAEEIAKKHKGQFVKFDDTHNRLYTFKCSDPDHPPFTVRLGLADRWCDYCSDKKGQWLRKMKKKDLSEFTANYIFNEMGGNEHFKNVMALSWTLRKINIKIKDTSTSAPRELKVLEDYKPRPSIKDFFYELESKDFSQKTISEIYVETNAHIFFDTEDKFRKMAKLSKIKTKDSENQENHVSKNSNISLADLIKSVKDKSEEYSKMTLNEIFNSLTDDEKFYLKTEKLLQLFLKQHKIKIKESQQ